MKDKSFPSYFLLSFKSTIKDFLLFRNHHLEKTRIANVGDRICFSGKFTQL